MKRLLIIPIFLITLAATATNYYVKNGGNDGADGLSDGTAWATISKVNTFWSAGTFAPGDSILFKRGDTWYGTITVAEPGTSGNPIVIGAYGIGAKPILTGFTTISTWSVYSGSVYEANIPNSEDQTNMVVIDGQPVAMGRYPDTGWRSYTTATTTTIYDASLPDSPDWTGAEVVINKEYWITDRCNITDQASGIITFSGGKYSGTSPNRRYFIQNDLRCVTAATEWYHDESAGKLYMYGNQEGKDVKMATLNRLIYNNGHDHIHIRDLKLTGSISHAIHLNSSAHYNRIQDCDISYAGGSAIEDYGGNFLEAHYNNIIHSNYGIYCTGSDSRITNNDIAYIGMINGSAFMPHATGIYISSTNITVEYNTIQYTEWSGINTSSASTYSIYRNFINYPCMLIDDGGGIYSTSSQGTRTISQNIVLNSGVGSEDWLIIPRGIYYDAGGSGASITNNIVAGCKGGGLLIHYGDNHTITGNLLFNNEQQAEFLKWGTGVSTGITFNNNILIAKTATQRSLRSLSYTTDEIKAWGNFDYNYYARPVDDDNHFYYASGYHTLAEWKALVTPDDAHSYGSPVPVSSEDHIHFIYNNTLQVKIYYLSAAMKDITGADYSGTVQLQPWTAIVLLGAGTVTEEEPSPQEDKLLKSGSVLLKSATGKALKLNN